AHVAHQDRITCHTSKSANMYVSIRSSFAHFWIAEPAFADARASQLQCHASYSTKSQREERSSLAWLDKNDDSTAAGVCSNEEGGGRFAGGRWRSLPTARDGKSCATKRSARSRGRKHRTCWRSVQRLAPTAASR